MCLLLTTCVSTQPSITPEPSQSPIIIESEIPTIYSTLHERLGIPLDELLAMPDDALTQLIEQNAALLGLSINGTPSVQPASAQFTDAIRSATDFLLARYDSAIGLLEESPVLGKGNFYLTEDNALAAHALAVVGESETAAAIRATLKLYGHEKNGFIEVAWGEPVRWPPLHQAAHHEEPVIATVGDALIRNVAHDGPGYYYDWSAYANLAFMAAVNELNQGNREAAARLYSIQAGTFDGNGFADKAFWDREGVYETLGVAWGVYAGALLCAPVPDAMLAQLLAQQSPDTGGFHTHYSADANRLADPNTETTAVALLALRQLDIPCKLQSADIRANDAWQHIVDSAVAFLLARHNPTVGLLNESPETAPDRYWLLTDNRLAAWALAATGHAADAATLHRTIDTFAPNAEHGLIESIAGVVVRWPPRTPVQNEIAPGIWLETRNGDEMLDWSDYADLTLYAAINAANQGQNETARDHYDHALSMFDGLGFQDKAFDGRYTTYKLALALLAAQRLNITPSSPLVSQLLAQQSADGGFVAHYTVDGQVGDANTETTALALLAISQLPLY